MPSYKGPRVLAIGLDAFEVTLMRRLIDEGLLPSLASIIKEGKWRDLESTAAIGSGSVWPTLVTGTPPAHHGQYGEWPWRPEEMTVRRYSAESLTPFWIDLPARGIVFGQFDVPFAPMINPLNGFEVSEWGAHDVLRGNLEVFPAGAARIVAAAPRHPFESDPPLGNGPADIHTLQRVANAAVEGVPIRGELVRELMVKTETDAALVCFPEIHHTAHYLWHTVEPEHPMFQGRDYAKTADSPALTEICKVVDKELGLLRDLVADGGSFIVFALHGMKPGRGVPNLTYAVMNQHGYSSPSRVGDRTTKQQLTSLFGSLKRNAPSWLRNLYRSRAPFLTQIRLAQSTMLSQYDWATTQAFALPTDQHGWVRVNLKGREAQGIVPLDRYESLCLELRELLLSLKTTDGDSLAREVLLPGLGELDPKTLLLPDVIVHWEHTTLLEPLEVDGLHDVPPAIARSRTGQHTSNAFIVAVGPAADHLGSIDKVEDLHKAIVGPLGAVR